MAEILDRAGVEAPREGGGSSFTRGERYRLAGLGGAVLALHAAGWGLAVVYAARYPRLIGLAALAYSFGLRHAFDADHIAAIDNTTRKFLSQGRRALGTGFFFSLGHSTVVLIAATLIALGAREVASFHSAGSLIGTGVSAAFLYLIGALNLVVLVDVFRVYREMKRGRYDREGLERTLDSRGLMNRFLGRLFRLIDRSWHMYPLGFLFGLGFDTATEIAILALAAVMASQLPILAIVSLPLVFAAGMSLMDTGDGVFMSRAYGWAFSSPLRKVYYNITVTGLSVAVALLVGTLELVQLVATRLHATGGALSLLEGSDLISKLGYVIVGMFVAAWTGSVIVWKVRHIEERWGGALGRPERGSDRRA